jgi:hypothetical protein
MSLSDCTPKEADRFWSRVDRSKGDDSCWLWGAACRRGYGTIRMRGKQLFAHRVAYMIGKGPIPRGYLVCHSCDVRYPLGDVTYRRCCNPRHLWAGTNADNSADMVTKKRSPKGVRHGWYTHPETVPRGSRNGRYTRPERTARGVRNGRAKLTEPEVREIRQRYAAGETQIAIAHDKGMNRSTISEIVRCCIWRYVV